MSNENNRRYVGEVFIDGKSDKLLQEFLTNLFNSYNGPGKGFNADMVDDWHLDDIINYIDEQDDTKLGTITIGQTTFTPFDSVKFLQLIDVIYDEFKSGEQAPWLEAVLKEGSGRANSSGAIEDDHYLLSDMLLDLYYALDINKIDIEEFYELKNDHNSLSNKHDQLDEEFQEMKDQLDDTFKEINIYDSNGEMTTGKFLNAQLLNGFRIIPITQAKYDALPIEQKEYWRNIYIIRDTIPDDYEDPIEYTLLKEIKIEFDEDTGNIVYYNGISDNPKILFSIEELFSRVRLNDRIRNYITTTDDIIYNIDAIKETLKEIIIHQNEQIDYPFLTRDEGKALVSSMTSEYGPVENSLNSNNHQTFDITHAFDNKFTSIDSLTRSLQNHIQNLNANIASNYYDKSAIDDEINNLKSTAADLRTSINSLTANIKEYVPKRVKSRWLLTYDNVSHHNETPATGIYMIQKGEYIIFSLNNPITHKRDDGSEGWQNLLAVTELKDLVLANDDVWPSNYGMIYSTTNGPDYKGHNGTRIRFHPMRDGYPPRLEAYIQPGWSKLNKVNIGWGQIVVPLMDIGI